MISFCMHVSVFMIMGYIYLTPHLLTLRYKKRDAKFHNATLKHEAILGLAAKVECQTSYKQQKKRKFCKDN